MLVVFQEAGMEKKQELELKAQAVGIGSFSFGEDPYNSASLWIIPAYTATQLSGRSTTLQTNVGICAVWGPKKLPTQGSPLKRSQALSLAWTICRVLMLRRGLWSGCDVLEARFPGWSCDRAWGF